MLLDIAVTLYTEMKVHFVVSGWFWCAPLGRQGGLLTWDWQRGESDCYETPDSVVTGSAIVRDVRRPDHPERAEQIDSTSYSSEELFKRFVDKTLDTSTQGQCYDAVRGTKR